MKNLLVFGLLAIAYNLYSQNTNPGNDPEAQALLQKVSDKYKACKSISASFKLVIQRPKLKPEDDDRKYTDTLPGKISMQGAKFKIDVRGQEIITDGKTLWTYNPADKEVQVNDYEETDDVFSPSKIFSLYKAGYMYQIKEKKVISGKNVTVVEIAPPNKKLSYFKIDISIDDASLEVLDSKVYEKNGARYIYKLVKQTCGNPMPDETFTFEPKKHPGVKLTDLR